MNESQCFQEILKQKYSFPRIQWLVGTASVICLIYLTSEEIWKIFDTQPFPEITFEGVVSYLAFFLLGLVIIHYRDTKKILDNKFVAITTSLVSIAIDVFVLSVSEFIVLYAIQVLPQDYLGILTTLLMGALPAALGSIMLSSLTSETLRKRAEKLYRKARQLTKQVAKLEDERKTAVKHLEQLRKSKREFDSHFQKPERQVGNENKARKDEQ